MYVSYIQVFAKLLILFLSPFIFRAKTLLTNNVKIFTAVNIFFSFSIRAACALDAYQRGGGDQWKGELSTSFLTIYNPSVVFPSFTRREEEEDG